jgi:hypothetical protein
MRRTGWYAAVTRDEGNAAGDVLMVNQGSPENEGFPQFHDGSDKTRAANQEEGKRMNDRNAAGGALVLGTLLCAGMIVLGDLVSNAITAVKALERTVRVKGLSEREVPAIVDRQTQGDTEAAKIPFRYSGSSTITERDSNNPHIKKGGLHH